MYDKKSAAYVKGISCSHCIDSKTDADRARFRERQKQIHLANERGEDHIGGDASAGQAKRARLKKETRDSQRKKANQANQHSNQGQDYWTRLSLYLPLVVMDNS